MVEDRDDSKEPQPADTPAEAQPPEAHAPVTALLDEVKRGNDLVAEAIQQIAAAVEAFARAAPAPAQLLSSTDLSLYRTITAARGVQEVNLLLAQGWEYIGGEYCEEVRKKSGVGGSKSVIAWTLYAIMGKREPLAETDREALAANEERRAWELGVPVEDETVEAPTAPEVEETTPIGTATRGRHITAASPRGSGFQPTGGLDR